MTKQSNQPSDSLPSCNSRFGIIQLSDLQFGENHRFNNPSSFIERLIDDIRNISGEYTFKPIYIVLSGDITEKAQQDEFKDAIEILGKLSDGLEINRMKIISVPGNHDVNWDLADDSQNTGDKQLKYYHYNSFVMNITKRKEEHEKCYYPRVVQDQIDLSSDKRLDLEFILLNSCEKENRSFHKGYVCQEKLQKILHTTKENECLKIAILHHPLHEKDSSIENASDIESILAYHKYNIILTGHVHSGSINAKTYDSGHQVIIASCGSTGVNKKQRDDGIQNQYCIHVIDLEKHILESIWRAYNPAIQTKFGLGGWTKDNSHIINPTKFPLPEVEHKPSIDIQAKIASSAKPKRSIKKKAKKKISKKDATYLAIANLLGSWNEKDKK